jgi:outer membrane receptor protein involved in Fe transport
MRGVREGGNEVMKSAILARRLLLAASVLSLSAPAFGQEQEASQEDEALTNAGEIVVTARKREESLIEVPLAITAFDQESIQQAGIESVADLAFQTPGFSFRQGFGRSGSAEAGASSRPAIRGMSNILGAANAGFFVDGIFVSGNITSYQLDNLERIEVIKGPQAALFGRQTFAGAINFVTRKPGNEFTGRVNATVGQYDHIELSGYVVLPIVEDKMSAEINGRIYSFGGDYVNQDNGKRDINDQRSYSFGGKLRFTPTDNFEMIAQFLYANDRDKGYSSFLMKNTTQQLNCFLPRITTNIPFPTSSTRSRGYFCGEIESPKTFAYNIDEIEALGYHGVDRETYRTSLIMEYTFDSDWSLTSITGFNSQRNQNGFDNSYVPTTNPSLTIEGLRNHDFSQELRLLSPRDNPFRALAGGYYFKSEIGKGFTVNTSRTSPNFGRVSGFDSDDEVRNVAVFGMLEYDVTERLTLTAEARYQEDKITGSNEVSVLGGVGQPISVRTDTFKSFLPRVTGKFAISSNWNVYASVAKGNKPGGFNDLPTDAIPSAIADFQARGFETFDEEEVWSYELGTKGRIGRLFFNVAAYYLDWTKQQLTQSQPYQRTNGTFTTFPFLVNAGKSEIKGIELELSGPLTDWFNFRLGYSYNDAQFVDFYDENTEELLDTDGRPSFLDADFTVPNPADVDGPNGQVKGNQLPQTPKHQLIATGDLHFAVADDVEFFVRGDLAYDSKRYVQVHNLAHTGDSYNLNLRTGVEWGDWTITAFVNNLLEDRTPLVGTRLFDFNRLLRIPATTGGFRTTFFRDFLVSSPRKRQFGVTANFKF